MSELRLDGCTPEPLLGYLKALGVLRLVTEQEADADARAAWRGGALVLETNLNRDSLLRFFLEEYRPTPIVAPWAGGSGFFGSDNRVAVDAIAESQSERLTEFAALIRRVRGMLSELGIRTKPSGEVKDALLRRYRRDLPDEYVVWMDTALVLHSEGQGFLPLLGTGGNDLRLDFTQNYMQRLTALGFPSGKLVPGAAALLRQALFGEATSGLYLAAVGRFDPGRAGGPNATTGFEGGSLVNPWDFVLLLEGSLVLAGAAARRLGVNQRDRAAFPFTVRPSTVGYASSADREESDSQGESWLPLWSRPASLRELRLVFAEGRAEFNGRQSRNGVDFARAVAALGVDRGVDAFIRYGFLKRSGKAFVAAPLGTFPVRTRRNVDLLREIDGWLERFRRACAGDEVPARFKTVLRGIDSAIYDYCRYAQGEDDASWLQKILMQLGAAERELAVGDAPPDRRRTHRPLAGLAAAWVQACDDGSPEYRLARSLAFLSGDPKASGPIRRYLEPVRFEKGRWSWAERGGHVVWGSTDVERNLGAVLTRRLLDAEIAGEEPLPLDSPFPAPLADVALFLSGGIDNQKMQDLLWGIMLIEPGGIEPAQAHGQSLFLLPAVYALLKLTFIPGRLRWGERSGAVVLEMARSKVQENPTGIAVKPEPAILSRLRAGDVRGASEVAARRLRASGLIPLASYRADGSRREVDWSQGAVLPSRLLAALLFPIPARAVDDLADLVLRRPQVESLT